MPHDTNTMLGIITALLVIALGLLPYEAPRGKQISRLFYSMAWCSLAGTLLAFIAEPNTTLSVVGLVLVGIGYYGVLTHFLKGGSIYVPAND